MYLTFPNYDRNVYNKGYFKGKQDSINGMISYFNRKPGLYVTISYNLYLKNDKNVSNNSMEYLSYFKGRQDYM